MVVLSSLNEKAEVLFMQATSAGDLEHRQRAETQSGGWTNKSTS